MGVDTTKIKHDIVLLTQQYSVKYISVVQQEVQGKIDAWNNELTTHLLSEFPYSTAEEELRNAQTCLDSPCYEINKIKHDLSCFEKFSSQVEANINISFWNDEIAKLDTNDHKKDAIQMEVKQKSPRDKSKNKNENSNKILRKLLQQEWRKLFDQAEAQWELKEIEAARRKFLHEIEAWLRLLQELDSTLSELFETGVFFGLSTGELTQYDIAKLKKWLQYIKEKSGVKELCKLLGRMRAVATNIKQEKIKYTQHITEYVSDINSKEEIIGIRLGKDIEYALPQELALMADNELSILFDMKYIEGRLMCFDMQGSTTVQKEETKEKVVSVLVKEGMGPMIICVDTSGSMSGTPETIAKAITLFMAGRAIEQKRDCLLINFSTSIEVMSLSGDLGMKHIIDFLSKSFHGGTDAEPALCHAISMMKEDNYAKADVLMISDFVMGSLTQGLQKDIYNIKKLGNKFYSLAIGNIFLHQKLKDIFDNEWVYNPATCDVSSLVSKVDAI